MENNEPLRDVDKSLEEYKQTLIKLKKSYKTVKNMQLKKHLKKQINDSQSDYQGLVNIYNNVLSPDYKSNQNSIAYNYKRQKIVLACIAICAFFVSFLTITLIIRHILVPLVFVICICGIFGTMDILNDYNKTLGVVLFAISIVLAGIVIVELLI